MIYTEAVQCSLLQRRISNAIVNEVRYSTNDKIIRYIISGTRQVDGEFTISVNDHNLFSWKLREEYLSCQSLNFLNSGNLGPRYTDELACSRSRYLTSPGATFYEWAFCLDWGNSCSLESKYDWPKARPQRADSNTMATKSMNELSVSRDC